jgi:hypothetical protein
MTPVLKLSKFYTVGNPNHLPLTLTNHLGREGIIEKAKIIPKFAFSRKIFFIYSQQELDCKIFALLRQFGARPRRLQMRASLANFFSQPVVPKLYMLRAWLTDGSAWEV